MDDNAHNPNYWWIKYIFNDTHSNCRQLATVHRSINQSVSIPESDVSSCDECLVSNCLHLLRTHSIHPHLAKLNPIKKHLSWNHQQVRKYVYSTSQSPTSTHDHVDVICPRPVGTQSTSSTSSFLSGGARSSFIRSVVCLPPRTLILIYDVVNS